MGKFLLALGLLLIAIVPQREPLRAQATGGEKTDTWSQSETAPPIRSTTRLVQVSVVVTDKKGEPVTGLSKQDFVVSDQGKPQPIAFFSAETPPTAGTLAAKLPPNVFTNRFDLTGQYAGAVTVVLFDALNTPVQDQAWVRNQVIQFLKSLQPREHVAIYALTTDLLLLHEFTQDSAALVAAANAFQPREQALHDASHPDYFNVTALAADKSWAAFQAAVNQTDARIADQYKLRSAEITAHALEAISNHLAVIPGRKNLLWVSGSFPANILVEAVGSIDRQNESTQKYSAAAAQALNRANIAVYPVDAGGIAPNAAMDPSRPGGDIGDPNSSLYCADCIEEAPGTSSAMNARQNARDTERMFADATGGLAFYGSNDIRGAMKRSFEDGRYAYTIGFYPDHGQWNGKFRKIKVQVSASGAQLRYRNGYFAEAEHTDSEKQAKQELQQAAMSPLNATGLGLVVSGKLSGPAADRKVEVHVALDPKQLQLRDDDRHRKGILDLYFVQRGAQGETVAAESQRIGLNLEEKQYQSLAQAGLVLARHLAISPQASELRVLVRDADSHALGSVTVPVTELLGGTEVAPAKIAIPGCANRSPSDKFTALNCEYLQSFFPGDSVNESPGFAVLMKADGKIAFQNGYGVRDLRSKIKIDAQTDFRLASSSKQFTAMAIMLLVHDGKLRYDQTLTDVFPEFPAYGKQITVRNLLNHTAGLPDYEDLMDAAEKTKGQIWSAEKQIQDAEVLQLLEKTSQGKFAPGTKWEYSNSGYVILGLVVAKVSGKAFREFLHERIFAPLKMNHSLVFEKGKSEVANRAYGYSKKENDFVETDQSPTSATQGDGGIYSNLEDLSKWDQALREHTLLSEEDFLPAITPVKLPPGAEVKLAQDVPASLRGRASGYGFGWFLNLQEPRPLMWHYGDTMGFKSAILRYARDTATVIVLCNRNDLDPGALALKATQLIISVD